MAYIVMAHTVMTHIVVAYIVMAYTVMSYIVMAASSAVGAPLVTWTQRIDMHIDMCIDRGTDMCIDVYRSSALAAASDAVNARP